MREVILTQVEAMPGGHVGGVGEEVERVRRVRFGRRRGVSGRSRGGCETCRGCVGVFQNILKVPSEATPEAMFQRMLRSEKAWRG